MRLALKKKFFKKNLSLRKLPTYAAGYKMHCFRNSGLKIRYDRKEGRKKRKRKKERKRRKKKRKKKKNVS